MASKIEITVGTRVYSRTFNKTDAEVRTILDNFGKMHDPPPPEGATLQQQLDLIGDKIVALIVRDAKAYASSTRYSASLATITQEVETENSL
jgi:hypothetical protein